MIARLVRRELRGGVRAFRLLVACLALGVAAIASIGSMRAALIAGLQGDARALLGGDIEMVSSMGPIPEALTSALPAGSVTSQVIDMRAMTHKGDASVLAEMKSVDTTYPLYGDLVVAPPVALADGEAFIDTTLASQLGAAVGDLIDVGEAHVRVAAIITREPDRGIRGFDLGPRLMLTPRTLEQTALLQPGSLARYGYRARLPAGIDAELLATTLRERDDGVRIVSEKNATPGVKRFIDRVAQFLTLVALTALLVGGVGVSNAVSSYLESKLATIATLKCVGATNAVVLKLYLALVGLLALAGIVLGLVIGVALPWAFLPLVAKILPVAASRGFYWQPIMVALLFGVATALVFGVWPLSRIADIEPAALFRARIAMPSGRPRGAALGVIVAGIVALIALCLFGARDPLLASGFACAVVVAFGVYVAVARGLARLSRLTRHMRPSPLRLGLAALGRSGAPTLRTVLSLGLGLTVLSAIAVIESNLSRELGDAREITPPAFFFLDIQRDEADDFAAVVRGLPGVSRVVETPMLRGRIVAVHDTPVEALELPERARWSIESERGITYSAAPPDNTTITEGAWWPADYSGEPLVSFDAELAADMDLHVGQSLTVSVLGRQITTRVASLRDIDWRNMGINFTMILSPNALAGAPHTVLATAYAAPASEDAIFASIAKAFPHVSTVRVRDALVRAREVITGIAIAVRSAAAITLIMGVLVLAGGVMASHTRRTHDAVIFQVLGATRAKAAFVFLVEHGAAGIATACVAAVLGSAAAYAVVARIMELPWHVSPVALLVTLVLGATSSLAVGAIATWRALSHSPARLLRED